MSDNKVYYEENTSGVDMEINYDDTSKDCSKEIKPVSMSKKSIGFLLIMILLIAVIICFTIRGCSISKKPQYGNSVNGVSVNMGNTSLNTTPSANENLGNEGYSSSIGSSPEDEFNSSSSEGYLTKVAVPSLGNLKSSTGMVSGKNIYRVGDEYLYKVSVILLVSKNDNRICGYYCPKKSYDSLSLGSSVNVQFQVDSEGNISIHSMSIN